MVMSLTSNRFADLRRRRVPRRNHQRHISRVIIGIVGRCDVRHVASYAIYDAHVPRCLRNSRKFMV